MSPARSVRAQCCIAGGGPAGMMLGYLLARAGLRTVVLEKHGDFLRDFRGDTIHPSTLAVMDELGLLQRFLQLPHQRIDRMDAWIGTNRIRVADLRRLHTPCPFVALMPQWDFLNFLAHEGQRLPTLTVMMHAEVTGLLRDDDRVTGVRATTAEADVEITADLTIAADGRHSTVRRLAELERVDVGAPIDVLWFRIAREPDSHDEAFAHIMPGRFLVTLDRGNYWQCAFVIAKGTLDSVKAQGIEAFRADLARIAPAIAPHLEDLRSWDDVKLLTVMIDRLKRWYAPGLLCIGDAAHAMSPIGGVGINLAIQDAVATANLLAAKLAAGRPSLEDLQAVQQRREWPTKMTQALQVLAQRNILTPILRSQTAQLRIPLPLRLLNHSRALRGIPARIIGLGFRPEHVKDSLIAVHPHPAQE